MAETARCPAYGAGDNSAGQLGNGSLGYEYVDPETGYVENYMPPVQVAGGHSFVSLGQGAQYASACAIATRQGDTGQAVSPAPAVGVAPTATTASSSVPIGAIVGGVAAAVGERCFACTAPHAPNASLQLPQPPACHAHHRVHTPAGLQLHWLCWPFWLCARAGVGCAASPQQLLWRKVSRARCQHAWQFKGWLRSSCGWGPAAACSRCCKWGCPRWGSCNDSAGRA